MALHCGHRFRLPGLSSSTGGGVRILGAPEYLVSFGGSVVAVSITETSSVGGTGTGGAIGSSRAGRGSNGGSLRFIRRMRLLIQSLFESGHPAATLFVIRTSTLESHHYAELAVFQQQIFSALRLE